MEMMGVQCDAARVTLDACLRSVGVSCNIIFVLQTEISFDPLIPSGTLSGVLRIPVLF
jgi:hypothetical protein